MNKGIVMLLVILCFSTYAFAQDEADALRYSYLTSGGTARAQAIGGAMGSLGGDISALSVNPAGIGFFKTNDFSVTPAFNSAGNTASYYGTTATNSRSALLLQNIGFIFAGDKHNPNSKWKNITFGIADNRLADFTNDLYYQGTINKSSDYSSYSDNYLITLANANETSVQNAQTNYPFGVSESVKAGLIGPVEDSAGNFVGWSSLPSQIIGDGYPLLQANNIRSRGGLNELNMAVAGNYDDKFYIGGGIDLDFIKYYRDATFTETNTKDQNSPLNYYDIYNYLNTTGVGINGKIGIIYSPVQVIRLGLAFHTPTYYSMQDDYYTTVTTHTQDQGVQTSTTTDITGGYDGTYTYNLTTPMHVVASATYIFGSGADNIDNKLKGFITADYEMVNYGNAHYRFDQSSSADVSQQNKTNTSISNLYTNASNFRIGGELKFNIFSVRAGLADYGSPYKSSPVNANLMKYSGGIGIRQGGIYLDLTYVYATQKGTDQPYYIIQPNSFNIPSPKAASYTYKDSNIIFTLGFKF